MISLDSIRAEGSAGTFPLAILPGIRSAACFFAAGFYGRYDVIHIADAGVSLVDLIDLDEGKLQEMSTIYPGKPGWVYWQSDAYDAARDMKDAGMVRDLVTVDPWTGDIPKALHNLPLWLSITQKYLLIGVCHDWFNDKHLEPTLDAFRGWVASYHWNGAVINADVLELRQRSTYRGGVFWALFAQRAK